MTERHTPEPWAVAVRNVPLEHDAVAVLERAPGRVVLVVPAEGTHRGTPVANADRIVACVNACTGVSSEDLGAKVYAVLRQMTEGCRGLVVLEGLVGFDGNRGSWCLRNRPNQRTLQAIHLEELLAEYAGQRVRVELRFVPLGEPLMEDGEQQ